MKAIDYGFACDECVQAIANDDYTGLDYSYNYSEAQQRCEEIRRGICEAPGALIIGDEVGFMRCGCDVCGSRFAGNKHEVSCFVEVNA